MRDIGVLSMIELATLKLHDRRQAQAQLLARLRGYTDAEVIYALDKYLGRQLHLRPYGWQYIAKFVESHVTVLRAESQQLSPLPKAR